MALLVGYVASPFERIASSCIFRSLQHLMLPLPGVIAPWSVGRGHDKIVQRHKKERSQEATPWPRNSMWSELDGGRIEPYILYDPKSTPHPPSLHGLTRIGEDIAKYVKKW